jgi:hypothetical protein
MSAPVDTEKLRADVDWILKVLTRYGTARPLRGDDYELLDRVDELEHQVADWERRVRSNLK